MLTEQQVEDIIQDRLDDLFINAKKEFPECEIELESPHDQLDLDHLYVKASYKPKEALLSDFSREELVEICKEQLLEFYVFITEIKSGKIPLDYTLETKCYDVMRPLKSIRDCLWNKDMKWTEEYSRIINGQSSTRRSGRRS